MQDFRSEIVAIRADARPIDGQFRGVATLAKPGVYQYSDGATTWTEWTPADTLSDPDYLDSLKLLPVTLDHPSPPVVDTMNARALSVGGMGDTVTVGADGILSQPIAVWDGAAASAARTTHRQISLGYRAAIDPTPGVTPDGQKYDRKQVKRLGNHVALVEEGRHGPRIRVRSDASGNVTDSYPYAERVDTAASQPPTLDNLTDRSGFKPEKKPMAQITLGTKTVEVADAAVATAVQMHVDALTAQIATVTEAQTRADTAAGALTAAKAEINKMKDDHEEALKTVVADAAKAARNRVALETQVSAICGADWKADGKTDRDCRVDACKALKVEVKGDESDDYLRAVIDHAPKADAKRAVTTADIFAATLNGGNDNRADGATVQNSTSLANWK